MVGIVPTDVALGSLLDERCFVGAHITRQYSTGKSLGVAACTAIVVGNMVGSGFYLSPAAVAPYGNLAIIAWIVMGVGAACLGLTFAKLARLAPATGGPYAYTRMAYGDFAGFLIAWGYWISIWASLPVIAIAFAGAVMDLVPGLHNRTMAVVLTLGAIWAVVLVNLRGVKAAGIFSEITTYTKLIPVRRHCLGRIVLHRHIKLQRVQPERQVTARRERGTRAAYNVRIFRAGVCHGPGGRCGGPKAHDPTLDCPRHYHRDVAVRARHYCRYGPSAAGATRALGRTVLRCGAGAVGAMGCNDNLDRCYRFGDWRPQWLDAADGSSANGCSARPTVSAPVWPALTAGRAGHRHCASRQYLPPCWSCHRLPDRLASQRSIILVVGLSTMAAVVPYAFCALATGLVAAYAAGGGPVPRLGPIEVIAFVFAVFTLYGCGAEPVLYGLIMLVLGIPVFVWQRRRASPLTVR